MSRKLISAQLPFKVLVAHIAGASDPSKGASGNPTKLRTSFTQQHFPEIPGRGQGQESINPQGKTPGRGTRVGHTNFTTEGVPVAAAGTITVDSASLLYPTTIHLGSFVLTSGEDFTVVATVANVQATGTATVVATPSTATLTIGGQALTDAAAARTPGSNDYNGALGTAQLISDDIVAAINDGANGFAAICTATNAGGTTTAITLTAVDAGTAGDAVTLVTSDAGDITVDAATFSGGVDAVDGPEDTATNLAAAIDDLVGYSGSALAAVVTVAGPTGPIGNQVVFRAGGVSSYLLTFSPDTGTMAGAEPSLGPIVSA